LITTLAKAKDGNNINPKNKNPDFFIKVRLANGILEVKFFLSKFFLQPLPK